MKILPIFIPHLGCPYQCVYCQQNTITKSTQPSIEEISEMVQQFCKYNHSSKKEIAFFGGTFTNLPFELQKEYLNSVNRNADPLTGIRLSTRPDAINEKILDLCQSNNVQTIELGIQSLADSVLHKSKRGYTSNTVIQSCRMIKERHINLGIQLMPGLPGSNSKTISQTIDLTVKTKPDFIRIYPTIILKDTELENWYHSGKFFPLTLEKAIEITSLMISKFNKEGIAIIKVGLHSDISQEEIIAGPYHQSFGELVRAYDLKKRILNNFENKTLEISPYDISLFKGFNSKMLNEIKSELNLKHIPIKINEDISKDGFVFTNSQPDNNW